MEATGAITEELLGQYSIIAMAMLLCITLLGYTPRFYRLLHHPLCKNQLVPPIKICFKLTYDSQLVHKHVALNLL